MFEIWWFVILDFVLEVRSFGTWCWFFILEFLQNRIKTLFSMFGIFVMLSIFQFGNFELVHFPKFVSSKSSFVCKFINSFRIGNFEFPNLLFSIFSILIYSNIYVLIWWYDILCSKDSKFVFSECSYSNCCMCIILL